MKLLTVATAAIALSTQLTFAAIGDIINFDNSTVTSGITAADTDGWQLQARTEANEANAHEQNILSSRLENAAFTFNVPAHTGLVRYGLDIYGLAHPSDGRTYSVAIGGSAATPHAQAVLAGTTSERQKQLFSKHLITGDTAHTVTFTHTQAGTNQWIDVDYAVIVAIPAPEAVYIPSSTDSLAQDHDGVIGTIATSNSSAITPYGAVTYELIPSEGFSLSGDQVSFTVPASPVVSYTAQVIANHAGVADTAEVTVNIQGVTGGGVSVQGIFGTQSSQVAVYNLNGTFLKTASVSNWSQGLPEGIYVTRTLQANGVVNQKLEVLK